MNPQTLCFVIAATFFVLTNSQSPPPPENLSEPPTPPPFALLVTEIPHLQTVIELFAISSSQGYCPIALPRLQYEEVGNNSYHALIAVRAPCPAWSVVAAETVQHVYEFVAEFSARGYVPMRVTAADYEVRPYATFEVNLAIIFYLQPTVAFRLHIFQPGELNFNRIHAFYSIIGFQLQYFSEIVQGNRLYFVAIWHKPMLSIHPRLVHFNLPWAQCLSLHNYYTSLNLAAISLRAFKFGGQTLCTGIWEVGRFGVVQEVTIERNITQTALQKAESTQIPLDISGFIDEAGNRQTVILWSDINLQRYPGFWQNERIPTTYLPGVREGFTEANLSAIYNTVTDLMKEHKITALSLAISKDEKLKLGAAFGYANYRFHERLTPNHALRIASISKSITATAIFKLVENGQLSLDQQVFGPDAILGTRYGSQPYSERLMSIQLLHLLQHTPGGYGVTRQTSGSDPMFVHSDLSPEELINFVIDNYPLNYPTGEAFAYCNFCYFLLGTIIEKVAGKTYSDFMFETIIQPAGMTSAGLGRGTFQQRLRNEVAYYGLSSDYFLPIELNQADGGWVMTPTDMLRFMARMDGFPGVVDLLQPSTLARMTEPSRASNGSVASGWIVGGLLASPNFQGYHHGGNTISTTSALARRDDGLSFAVVVNGHNSATFSNGRLYQLVEEISDEILAGEWPQHDLFAP